MRSGKVLLLLIFALVTGCGGGGSSSSPPASTPTNNVISVTVNGSLCSNTTSSGYLNKPCVSVTICTPGTSTCQTINDVLLDTGSYGLRIFKQALNVSLTQVTAASGSLAECVQYADGSSDWGPVQMAGVILASESTVTVPIQVIDQTFAGTGVPTGCAGPLADTSPSEAGFTGILGVGFFAQDCGSACASYSDNGMYYTCNGSNCSGTTVSLSNQVQNPVPLLPQDNNGVLVQLPSVQLGGTPSVNGSLVLGIGTQSNNTPSPAVNAYIPDLNPQDLTYLDIVTIFEGISYGGFLDTGSNGLFFPSPSASLLPDCASPYSDWFCPSSTVSLSATNTGASGSPSGVVSFQIGNFINLANSSNNVFADIGGPQPADFGFSWGLPFFFGRNVYIGIGGTTSSLGTGPYWAY